MEDIRLENLYIPVVRLGALPEAPNSTSKLPINKYYDQFSSKKNKKYSMSEFIVC